MKAIHLLRLVLALAFTLCPLHAAPPPGILNHQGRIVVNGVNPDNTTGFFKFALVNAAGTTTFWSHDGSSSGGSAPVGALTLQITQGHYAVGLGQPGLMQPIPPSVFTNNDDVRLRIWFNNELLTPDRRITSAGYALTAGALADPSFVGTTGNTPLDIVVNNQRALRLQPDFVSDGPPSLVGGFSGNSIAPDAPGAVIAGGGDAGFVNTITAAGNYAFIGGGASNTASAAGAVVSGGGGNVASGLSSVVPGGDDNTAGGSYSFAAGLNAKATHNGTFVWADSTGAAFESTASDQFLIRAAGGVGINKNNPAVALDVEGTVRATAFEGMGAPLLFATTDNQPLEFSVNGLRAFRLQPRIVTILGVPFRLPPNLIGGSEGNTIDAARYGAVIAGGGEPAFPNQINASGDFGTISGGQGNTVGGFGATVPGGVKNTASGNRSFAAGNRAKAVNTGTYVWADSQEANFTSTADNQFLIRAAGGVGINTATPGGVFGVQVPISFGNSSSTVSFTGEDFTPALVMTGGPAPGVLRLRNGLEVWPNAAGTAAGFVDVRSANGTANIVLKGDTGRIGIGTTNPNFQMEVIGTAAKTGGGSWSVASDARLKKNVADLHGSLDRLLRLRSVSFEYRDPARGVGPGPQIGFIAQDVREVLPQWVTEGSDGMLAVGVTGFESLAVDALRELRAEKDRQIGELKAENAELKQRLERLERAVEALAPPAAPVATTAAVRGDR